MTPDQLRYASVTCRKISERYHPDTIREDLAQIGLEAIVRERSLHEHLRGYLAWMGRVATWAMNDEMRRRNGRRDRGVRKLQPLHLEDAYMAPSAFEDCDLRVTLQKLSEGLTEAHRHTIGLLYAGYTKSEIAAILGVTPAAITLRVQAVRRLWSEHAEALAG